MSSHPSKPEASLFCDHNILNAHPLSYKHSSYCPDCSSLVISSPETASNLFLIKPQRYQRKSSFDPLKAFFVMKSKTLLYNIPSHKTTTWYYKNRKKVIIYLQKLTLKMRYSDDTFYLSLFYLDQILSSIEYENDRSIDSKLEYYLLGVFLIVAKTHEHNIFEPNLNQFENLNGEALDLQEIKKYEIKCLQLLKYDLFKHSAYDWLTVLLSNGFVFEDENCCNIINDIYSYCKKSLAAITNKDFFFKYFPFQIAFSLIKITREKFGLDSCYEELLYQIYQTPFTEFKFCYKDVKTVLDKKDLQNIPKPMSNSKPVHMKLKSSPSPNPSSLHSPHTEHTTSNTSRYKIECSSCQKGMETTGIKRMTISSVNSNPQTTKVQSRIKKRRLDSSIGGTFISCSTTIYNNTINNNNNNTSRNPSLNAKKGHKKNNHSNKDINVITITKNDETQKEDSKQSGKVQYKSTITSLKHSHGNKSSFVNEVISLNEQNVSHNNHNQMNSSSNMQLPMHINNRPYCKSFVRETSKNNKIQKAKTKLFVETGSNQYKKKIVMRSFVNQTEQGSNSKGKTATKIFLNTQRNNPIVTLQSKLPLIQKPIVQRLI